MGIHLTDSIFQRRVPSVESRLGNEEDEDSPGCEWFGTGGGDITVLEVGGQRASGEFLGVCRLQFLE